MASRKITGKSRPPRKRARPGQALMPIAARQPAAVGRVVLDPGSGPCEPAEPSGEPSGRRTEAVSQDPAPTPQDPAPTPQDPAPTPQDPAPTAGPLEPVSRAAALVAALPTAEGLYQHFLDGLTEQTRTAYGEDLAAFARWLGAASPEQALVELFKQPQLHANQIALSWQQQMKADGYAPATQARRMSALRAAVKLAHQLGLVSWTLHVRLPKAQRVRDTRGVDPADVRRMLAACDATTAEGLRDRALITLLFTLGLRRIEVVRLTLSNYDRRQRRLLVHGKGFERDPNKVQWRDLPMDTARALDEWIAAGHRDAGAAEDPALFYGWKNNHRTSGITPRGVHYVVSKLGERVGLRVWPHGFRHSAVTTALKEGHKLEEAQSFARHESATTTQIYNDDVDDAPGRVAATLARVLRDEEK